MLPSATSKLSRIALLPLAVISGLGASRAQTIPEQPRETVIRLPATVGWIGNSYSGKSQATLQDVADLCVCPEGTVFTNVGWDEAGGNVQEYRNGNLARVAGHTHGWGYEGGEAVTANSKYLFFVQSVDSEGGGLKGRSWPAKGRVWSGVSRRLRSNIRLAAPFGTGRGGEGDTLMGAFLPVSEFPEGHSGGLRGLCASETELFVSSPADSAIKVYDAESLALRRTWSVARPDRIAGARRGRLWVLQSPEHKNGIWRGLCFTSQGKALPQRLAFPAGVVPAALAVDARNRLLVADNGPDQNLKIYTGLAARPKLAATRGVRGGIFAGPKAGAFGDLRFNAPRGVGADAAGNLYVASSGSTGGGSTILESYSPEGKLRWRRFGLTFVDLADADPDDPTNIYTKEERFALTDGKPAGQEVSGGPGWIYRGYTVNPRKYPDDPRLHLDTTTAWVRRLHGEKILFVTGMTADQLSVFRFAYPSNGETAIPCALFAKSHLHKQDGWPKDQPERGEWLWMDRNGDGRMQAGEFAANGGVDSQGILWPDEQGTLWQVNGKTIRALPLLDTKENGAPQWSYKTAVTVPLPPEFDEVRRLRYLPRFDQDVMLLGGNQGDNHNQHWKPMGPVLCRYDGWRSGKPRLTRRIVLPYEKGASGHESVEPISFDVAGDYVFVAYTRGLAAEGLKNAFVKVLRLSDLSVVGNLSAESELGETGLLDLVDSVRAVVTKHGEYLVFFEDDAKAKVPYFRWLPGT